MSSQADEIEILLDAIKQETQNHLLQKAQLSSELAHLTNEEEEYKNKLNDLITRIDNIKPKDPKHEIEILELLNKKEELNGQLNGLNNEYTKLETKYKMQKTDQEALEIRISHLEEEKRKLTENVLFTQQQLKKTKRSTARVQNEKQKISKIKGQIKRQRQIKKNLDSFLDALNCIELIISSHSPLSETKKRFPSKVTNEIEDLVITAKTKFDSAQNKFSPNSIIPFLIEADEAYRKAILALIKLCDTISDTLTEKEFTKQVFTLVNSGFLLNTRHLNAVDTMLSKLEKGIEIAPLASFSNEIRDYYYNNLLLLRITSEIITLD